MKLMGLGQYTLDIDQIFEDNLRALVNRGWRERVQIRKRLQEKIPFWQNDLKNKIGLLKTYYNERQCSLSAGTTNKPS